MIFIFNLQVRYTFKSASYGMSERYKRMNDILDVSIDLFSALRAKGVHVEYKPDSEIIIHRIAKQEHGAA